MDTRAACPVTYPGFWHNPARFFAGCSHIRGFPTVAYTLIFPLVIPFAVFVCAGRWRRIQ